MVCMALAPDTGVHDRAITLAREGQHDQALPLLRRLVDDHPDNAGYLYDYVTVLGWAERDGDVLALRERTNLARAPIYVIETFARAARNQRQFPLAIELYRSALARDERRQPARVGLALSLADNGDGAEAETLLQNELARRPNHPDLLEALAYTYASMQRTFDAFVTYDRVLRVDPGHREARRQRVLLASQLGAPHQAGRIARATPDLLSPDEMERITQEQAGQSIQWGGFHNPNDPTADIDAAIASLRSQLDRMAKNQQTASPIYRQAQFNLIVALRDRQRSGEAIALYEELVAQNVDIPRHVQRAAADAYLTEHRPAQARDIGVALLRDDPADFDTRMTLYYAYFDTGEYAQALALIDETAAQDLPPDRKLRSSSMAAMGRAWTGQLGEAQRRYETLVDAAPNNPYLRADLGYVYLWRGWPRLARQEFRTSKTIEPAVLGAHIGEVNAQRRLHEFTSAESQIDWLTFNYPDNRQVQRLRREWEVHNMRELLVQVSRSANTAPQVGTDDLALDTWLYTAPLRYSTRAFGHLHYANSRFPEGTGLYRRAGAGLEYRVPDYELVGELSTGYRQDAGLGMLVRGAWMPDDFWRLGAYVDTYSNDVPLRGRLNEDIDGWGIGVNADYTFHESRALSAALQQFEFSDDNRRRAASIAGRQRLYTGPVYKLDGRLGAYWSNNTRDGASYYNPARDLSLDASLTNEWLLFRRHNRSLVHRLGLSLGSYRQSGFGANGTWGLNYEHEWNLGDRTYLLYGVARSRPVYDGVSETQMRYYLTLDRRF